VVAGVSAFLLGSLMNEDLRPLEGNSGFGDVSDGGGDC
jgi:hypothetical protein